MSEMAMRIEELAAAAGVSTRNVRAYQSLGVLAPPTLVGRVGFYGESHLERLGSISRLHHEGFSLTAIRALFDACDAGRTLEDLLGVRRRAARAAAARTRDPLDELAESFRGWRGRPVELLPSSFVTAHLSAS